LEEAGCRFSLQLRTFGSDAEVVVRELNAFCEGRHPFFPGLTLGASRGVDHTLDVEADPESHACLFRDQDGPVMVLGTLEQPGSREDVRRLEERGHTALWSLKVRCGDRRKGGRGAARRRRGCGLC
jgi:hypothetical protein